MLKIILFFIVSIAASLSSAYFLSQTVVWYSFPGFMWCFIISAAFFVFGCKNISDYLEKKEK